MENMNVFFAVCLWAIHNHLQPFQLTAEAASLQFSVHPDNLSCFSCSETFKHKWVPFTPCLANLSEVPLRLCHAEDRYCRVDRTTVKGMVVSISRSCTQQCLYGCRAYGYAITQFRCTSCCQTFACNTDNAATSLTRNSRILLSVTFLIYVTAR